MLASIQCAANFYNIGKTKENSLEVNMRRFGLNGPRLEPPQGSLKKLSIGDINKEILFSIDKVYFLINFISYSINSNPAMVLWYQWTKHKFEGIFTSLIHKDYG